MKHIGKIGVAVVAVAISFAAQSDGSQGGTHAKWLSHEQASKLVGGDVVEVVAPDVRQSMHAQLFRVPGWGAVAWDSVLIMDGRPYKLGQGQGGYGLTSFCVADLDGDGVA